MDITAGLSAGSVRRLSITGRSAFLTDVLLVARFPLGCTLGSAVRYINSVGLPAFVR